MKLIYEKSSTAKIVQCMDEAKTLPDGSKIIYAESDDKIVLYHKLPLEKGDTYIFDRNEKSIQINGTEGTNEDKQRMIYLGAYFFENMLEKDLPRPWLEPALFELNDEADKYTMNEFFWNGKN